MENIEFNPFFNSLQNEFSHLFEEAQAKSCAIFVPISESLKNVAINKEIISVHLAKSSPYFQGEYVANDGRSNKVFRVQNGIIYRSNDFQDTGEVKIVGEEAGYNKRGQSYKIYLIDKPLQNYGGKDTSNENEVKESNICASWLDGSKCPTIAQSRIFLHSFGDGKILDQLDINLEIMLKNYLFLSDFLAETAEKLRKLIDTTITKLVENEPNLGPKTITVLPICMECYVMGRVSEVLFPVICNRFQEEDMKLNLKLKQLLEADVTPMQLGALEVFSCPIPASVVELARLPSLLTPREQLQCIKNTIDLISAEIKQHLMETRGFLSFTAGLPCVTADDLIPALLTTIVKSKLNHLVSNNYYMETFSWSVSSIDIYGYSLASFKAAIEYLQTVDITKLLSTSPSSINNLKKELSLEELMEVSGKLDEVERSERRGDGKGVCVVDRQMEKITKMIEASTKELSQVQDQGFF